jgi:hypothetical protein
VGFWPQASRRIFFTFPQIDIIVPLSDSPNSSELNETTDEDELEEEEQPRSTQSGRTIREPTCLIEELGATTADYEFKLTKAENHYYEVMKELHENESISGEINCVGAGIGGGFTNTNKLQVMKYKEAIQGQDVKQWETAVDKEHDHMIKHSVWQEILWQDCWPQLKFLFYEEES